MHIRTLITAISLLLLLGACSAEEAEQPEKIEVEMNGFGITDTLTATAVITEISTAMDRVEWQPSAPEMTGELIASLTFFYPSGEIMEYEVWFNEDSGLLELSGNEEGQTYGVLDEQNSQALSTLLIENTVEKFSLQ